MIKDFNHTAEPKYIDITLQDFYALCKIRSTSADKLEAVSKMPKK